MAISEELKKKREFYLIYSFFKFLKRTQSYDEYKFKLLKENVNASHYKKYHDDKDNEIMWFYSFIKSKYKIINKGTIKGFIFNPNISINTYKNLSEWNYWKELNKHWLQYIELYIDYKDIVKTN